MLQRARNTASKDAGLLGVLPGEVLEARTWTGPKVHKAIFEQQEKPNQGARIRREWMKRERGKHEC